MRVCLFSFSLPFSLAGLDFGCGIRLFETSFQLTLDTTSEAETELGRSLPKAPMGRNPYQSHLRISQRVLGSETGQDRYVARLALAVVGHSGARAPRVLSH